MIPPPRDAAWVRRRAEQLATELGWTEFGARLLYLAVHQRGWGYAEALALGTIAVQLNLGPSYALGLVDTLVDRRVQAFAREAASFPARLHDDVADAAPRHRGAP